MSKEIEYIKYKIKTINDSICSDQIELNRIDDELKHINDQLLFMNQNRIDYGFQFYELQFELKTHLKNKNIILSKIKEKDLLLIAYYVLFVNQEFKEYFYYNKNSHDEIIIEFVDTEEI